MKAKRILFAKLLIFGFCFLNALSASAQEQQVEMADALRSNGKIYVVVTCLAVIFACFMVFLILTERKLSRLEKIYNEKK
jgi:uncharacterized membrane protein YcjF (UPF0283 family)